MPIAARTPLMNIHFNRPQCRAGPSRLALWAVLASVGLAAARAQQAPPNFADALRTLLGRASTTENAGAPQPLDGEADVQARDAGLLDLHVRDTELVVVLEMLSYESRTNIVTTTGVSGRVSANLYGVTLEQALQALLLPNQYVYHRSGNTVFVGKPEELAAFRPSPQTRVFRLRYIGPDEAAKAIEPLLGEKPDIVRGGESSTAGTSGTKGDAQTPMGATSPDYLIVTAQPDQLEAAARLLTEIDRRPEQVLIESTVLRATLNETNQLGIDFTILGGVDFENVNSLSNASSDLTTGPLPPEFFQETTMNVNTNFAANVQGGGFTFGIINNGVAAFVRALEEVTDVSVVANPKIVALNKQEAEVIVGRRDGYLTTTVTETAAIQTVDFLETGTQIRFRPLVNPDRTVRLSVHPKDSNGGLTAANLPFEETTEAHADILVDDGDTVLIGGLFRERTLHSRSQIPGLGDVPGLGLLFGSQSDQTIREEVIILLTVHVLQDSPAEQVTYQGLLEDVERVRVGSRRGLLGTGRERLAQAFYAEALRQLEAGHNALALLNLRMALHNQPRLLPAFRLKEDLIGKRMWDEDGARMRTFVWDLLGVPPATDDPSASRMFGRPRAAPRTVEPDDNHEDQDRDD